MSKRLQETMVDLLDGVERHLCTSAPQSARNRLATLRSRVSAASSRKEKRALQEEVEACLQSRPYYRAAARRYLRALFMEEVIPTLEKLLGLAKRHRQLTGR